MTNCKIAALILTYNEEKHLERCINSLSNLCHEIIIIDSFSSDQTKQISKKYNCKFLQNPWVNYSSQFNWGLKQINSEIDWVLRIDADEFLTDELKVNLKRQLPILNNEITGISFTRLMYFLNKPLKKGGMYPINHLRLFRNGLGHCEERWMDERIILKYGKTEYIKGDLIDYNLNNINWWTQKHNNYAVREAIDILNHKFKFFEVKNTSNNLSKNGMYRRKFKGIYNKLPLFLRPFLFFIFRYFIQFGFLEGKKGLIWNILQCFWYRFLVDLQIYEAFQKAGDDKNKLIKYFKKEYNFDITKINP